MKNEARSDKQNLIQEFCECCRMYPRVLLIILSVALSVIFMRDALNAIIAWGVFLVLLVFGFLVLPAVIGGLMGTAVRIANDWLKRLVLRSRRNKSGKCFYGHVSCVLFLSLMTTGIANASNSCSKLDIEDFVNGRKAFSNVFYLTITNLAPVYVFANEKAYKQFIDRTNRAGFKSTQVLQNKLYFNFSKQQLFASQQQEFELTENIFTNRTGVLWGRSGNQWWIANRYGFQVLDGAATGAYYDKESGQTNDFFGRTYQQSIVYFKLGIADLICGTFLLNGNVTTNRTAWSADSLAGGGITGDAWIDGSDIYLQTSLDKDENYQQIQIKWSTELQLPRSIKVARGGKKGISPVIIYTLQKLTAQTNDLFNYASHTNSGDVLFFLDKNNGSLSIKNGGNVQILPNQTGSSHRLERSVRILILGIFCFGSTAVIVFLFRFSVQRTITNKKGNK